MQDHTDWDCVYAGPTGGHRLRSAPGTASLRQNAPAGADPQAHSSQQPLEHSMSFLAGLPEQKTALPLA